MQLFSTIFYGIRNWFEICKNQESTPLTDKEDEEDVIPGTLLLKLQTFIRSHQYFANDFHSLKLYEQSLICRCFFFCIGPKHFFESLFCTELDLKPEKIDNSMRKSILSFI